MFRTIKIPMSVLCVVLLIFRMLLMWVVPVLDKTEARYAEIARLMYATGDWVVPQIEKGIPFWAKPPLSTWLSAISFKYFGVHEFSARLPALVLSSILLIGVGKIAKERGVSFYVPVFVLLTIPEFLIHVGVVSTDTTLLFSITLIMVSFWKSIQDEKKSIWNYLFFIGIGLGILAKGPITVLLTIPSIVAWCMLDTTRIKKVWKRLPWLLGSIITIVIAVPWYILAERQTPGFLNYFIVGEHIKRYTDSGWKGDKYGFAKTQPLGMIWGFLIAFVFPWIQIVGYSLWKDKKEVFKKPWVSYLVVWLFWTPIFFMFSKNAIHTYILPITIPIALLIVTYWNTYQKKKRIISIGLLFPIVAFITFLGLQSTNTFEQHMNTDKYMLAVPQLKTQYEIPIYYWKKESYSSQFYTEGSITRILDERDLDMVLQTNERIFIIVPRKMLHEISDTYRKRFTHISASRKSIMYLVSL